MAFELVSPADTERLLFLVRAFHAEDGHPLDAEGETAVVQLPSERLARCWLIRSGGAVVGYVVLTLGYSIEYGGRDGFIDDLYLLPKARGRRLGARALDFVEEQARSLGVRALHLEVEIANDRAYALYCRRGFKESGRRLLSRRLSSGSP